MIEPEGYPAPAIRGSRSESGPEQEEEWVERLEEQPERGPRPEHIIDAESEVVHEGEHPESELFADLADGRPRQRARVEEPDEESEPSDDRDQAPLDEDATPEVGEQATGSVETAGDDFDDDEVWYIRDEEGHDGTPVETEEETRAEGGGGGGDDGSGGGDAAPTPHGGSASGSGAHGGSHGHGSGGIWGVFTGLFGVFVALSWQAIKGAAKMAQLGWGGGGGGGHKSHDSHEKHDDHGHGGH